MINVIGVQIKGKKATALCFTNVRNKKREQLPQIV